MSRYWDNFYAQRDRDRDNIKKVDVKQLIRGVVIKKQITNTTNTTTMSDKIKGLFNERQYQRANQFSMYNWWVSTY